MEPDAGDVHATVDGRGNIYAVSQNNGGPVRAFAPNGDVLWELPVPATVPTTAPVLGADGTLYVGALGGGRGYHLMAIR